MSVLKEFECKACGTFDEVVDSDSADCLCPKCGLLSQRVFLTAPALTGDIRRDFKPHYDFQFGQHFQSYDDKKRYLESTGRKQVSGALTQRDSKITPHCTKDQAAKNFGLVKPTRTSAATRNETIG